VSHEHSDHIKGVGVLMRKYGLKLYVNQLTWNAMKHKIGAIEESQVVFFETNEPMQIGDIHIKPFSISHDAADPVGFTFSIDSAKLCVATDLGVADEQIVNEICDCDLLMIEANHDEEMLKMGKYPYYLKRRILSEDGHISNEYAGGLVVEAAKKGRVNQVLLGHLSKENNFPELAYETVRQVVENSQIQVGVDLNIDMTYRDRVSRLYKIRK
jgi:phosphoribosyl 1,2-cyclic phosphodiesterase